MKQFIPLFPGISKETRECSTGLFNRKSIHVQTQPEAMFCKWAREEQVLFPLKDNFDVIRGKYNVQYKFINE